VSGDADPGWGPAGTGTPDGSHCITCGDVAVPMTVVRVDGALACCESGQGREHVEIALVGDVVPGDEVLVHAGVALVRSAGGSRRRDERGEAG
jgi:hydrogenase expression/formation protein HypC